MSLALSETRIITDCCGRIIVVECKVMRVVIFDMMGNVLDKFSCSRYLEYPIEVVVNDQMEIFFSDSSNSDKELLVLTR